MKDEVLVWIANKRRVANIVLESHGRKGGGVGLDDSRFGHGDSSYYTAHLTYEEGQFNTTIGAFHASLSG